MGAAKGYRAGNDGFGASDLPTQPGPGCARDRKKRERWERILKEAAEQCHRGRIPELGRTLSFDKALIDANKRADVVLIASVEEGAQSIRSVLQASAGKRYAVFIGPEGGFSPEEVKAALAKGCIPVSMGERVLRMETAAITAVALIQYELSKE